MGDTWIMAKPYFAQVPVPQMLKQILRMTESALVSSGMKTIYSWTLSASPQPFQLWAKLT